MTLLEKLVGTSPLSEESKQEILDGNCPSDFTSLEHIPDPKECHGDEITCEECWNREYEEPKEGRYEN